MRRHTRKPLGCASRAVVLLLAAVSVWAQESILTKNSESGFRRFIEATQRGELGEDVSNANIAVAKSRVELELVRPGQASKRLTLAAKDHTQDLSRYFRIDPGEGATAADAAQVGKLLDRTFATDPFEDYF